MLLVSLMRHKMWRWLAVGISLRTQTLSLPFWPYSVCCIFILMLVPSLLQDWCFGSRYYIFIHHPNKQEIKGQRKKHFFPYGYVIFPERKSPTDFYLYLIDQDWVTLWKRVSIAGKRLLPLEEPARKIGPWLASENLVFDPFPTNEGGFWLLNYINKMIYAEHCFPFENLEFWYVLGTGH